MESTVEIRHVSLEIHAAFERVARKLEQFLGRFADVFLYGAKRLEEAEGEEGLMLFNIDQQG